MIITPWGAHDVLGKNPDLVKLITIMPGQRLSLQSHQYRTEVWAAPRPGLRGSKAGVEFDLLVGHTYIIPQGMKHRLWNPTDQILSVVELIYGEYDPEDITRYEDDYGRSTT